MLDHDPSNYGPSLTPDEFMEILIAIDPKIAKAARVIRGSVSAGVHLLGEAPKNNKGFHVYIPVKDASDIPEYGKLLFDYLWLNGHGYIALSSNGSLLLRSPIDAAVFSAERLDFVGKPIILSEELEYTQPQTVYVPGAHLNTLSLPELTTKEEEKVAALITQAKEAIKPASLIKVSEWKTNKITAMQKAGVSAENATHAINQILEGHCKNLYGDFILEFPTEDVLVSEVLKTPETFNGKALADPIECREYGKSTAKFWFNDGNPVIHSLAHGQQTSYFLHQKPDWKKELDEHVELMNKTLSSVMVGGKHKIMRLEPGSAMHEGREVYVFYSRSELSKVYDNAFIKTGEKVTRGKVMDITKNPLMAWASHKNSISYSGGVVFLPGKEAPTDYVNTWKGLAVDPNENRRILKRIYRHINNVVCAGDAELSEYIFHWIAYTFQNPDKPAGTAIVLRGEKGSGKGTLGHFLRKIWGNHGLHISNAKYLVGAFNGHLLDVCFLFADEAFYSGDKQHEGVLKAMVTEPTILIERKGIDAVAQSNYLKILMATNSKFAVPTSRDERRYCVTDVSSERIGDAAYFNALHQDCNSEEIQSAFLYEMLHVDLSDWNSGKIPESVGLREQRYHSMESYQKWLVGALLNGTFGVCGENITGDAWNEELSSKELFGAYVTYCDTAKTGEYRRFPECVITKYLGKMYDKVKRTNSNGQRGYFFGSLKNAIKAFEEYEKVSITELIK